MTIEILRRIAPIAVPCATVAVAWVAAIGPASAGAERERARLDDLRARLASAQDTTSGAATIVLAADPAAAFDVQVSSGRATADLLGHLTRLALAVGARNLFIDSTGEPMMVAAAAGPRAAGTAQPDPRLVLFDVPLQYSSIPMKFDASYAAAGEFLWRLRDLPALVEVRRMSVRPQGQEEGEDAAALPRRHATYDGTVTVSLTLFVYARRDVDAVPAAHGVVR